MNNSSESTHAASPIRSRLREKTPEILIEAASVVLALLLAFGANAWHEGRQKAQLASSARLGVVNELGSNREQLDATRQSVDQAIGRLRAAIAKLDAGGDLKQSPIAIISPLSPLLPSSAAWQTAEATGTVGDFDYAWTLQVAKTYELQSLFLSAQQRVIYPPTPVAVPGMEVAGTPARRMYYTLQLQEELLNMEVLANFGAALEHSYADLLQPAGAGAQPARH